MKRCLLILLISLLPLTALAEGPQEEISISYGDGHAFSLRTPIGWKLDRQSGLRQRLQAVFFPEGTTWSEAPVIAYVQIARKDEVIKDIPSLVRFNVESFHKEGSPKYTAKLVKSVKSEDGKHTAQIYFFEGDNWGNFEAAGYIEEDKTINFVVLSARSKEEFQEGLKPFEAIVSSYMLLPDRSMGKKK